MSALDLRPLTLGELLDRSFSMFRHNLWLFVGVMAIPTVFALAFAVVAQFFQVRMPPPGSAPESFDAVLPALFGFLAVVFIGMTAYLVAYTIALGATTMAVSDLYVGRSATIAGAYTRVQRYIGRLVWLMVLVMLRVAGVFLAATILMFIFGLMLALVSPMLGPIVLLLGMLVTGVGSFYMLLRYSLAVPALVLEGLTAREALGRSVELADGTKWRLLFLCVCAAIVAYAGAALLQGPFLVAAMAVGIETPAAFWLQIAGAVAGAVGQAFTSPIMIIGLVLQYYDARMRTEALDIDLMLDALDPVAAPAGGASA